MYPAVWGSVNLEMSVSIQDDGLGRLGRGY
jgi:hypothetical protein